MTVDKDKFIAKLRELSDQDDQAEIMRLLGTVFHPDICDWSPELNDIVVDQSEPDRVEIIENTTNEIASLKMKIMQLKRENSQIKGAYTEACDRMQQAEALISAHAD